MKLSESLMVSCCSCDGKAPIRDCEILPCYEYNEISEIFLCKDCQDEYETELETYER